MKTATELFNLSGRVALVTGASRGIGQATATLLAAQGAHVIVSSRKLEACQQVVEAINSLEVVQQANGSAEAMACHVGNMDDIESIFKAIKDKHRRLDILINNAAANPYFGHIVDTDLAAFQKTVDVNVRGYFFMSSAAAKLMRDTETPGSIINVASVNGERPAALQGIYSITKAAVISMTKAFAKECAEFNVRVNALLPGFTDTKFASTLTSNEQIKNMILALVPQHRIAQPEEMAGAMLYLASDASSYTTGTILNVDGGFLA